MEIKAGDIVKFSDKVTPLAAIWCHKHDITGLVVEECSFGCNIWRIDTVLKYPIWVPGEHLHAIANIKDSPTLSDAGYIRLCG